MKQPDLEAWGVFARVLTLGSFARAAEELSISNGTVSKIISRLETHLGERLFHRSTRRLSLTETGRSLARRAQHILAEAEAAEAQALMHSSAPRGRLKLAAPMSFGLLQITPALPEFLKAYPEIAVDLLLDDKVIDMVASGIDVAIRIADLPSSSLISRTLCPVQRYLVGAPEYFEKHGRPRHPADLAHHACLNYSYLPSGNRWHFTHPHYGPEQVQVKGPLSANNADVLKPALKAGLGIALQPDFVAWKGIQDGILERVMAEWSAPPLNVNILTPAGGIRPPRVAVLIDFLVRRFAAEVVPWRR